MNARHLCRQKVCFANRKLIHTLLVFAIALQFPFSATAGNKTPEHIAVVELHRRGVPSKKTKKVTNIFRDELSRHRDLKVLSRVNTQVILNYHRLAIGETGKIIPHQSEVSEAKKAYFELALARADKLISKVIEKTLQHKPLQRNYRALIEAYTMQGIIAMAQYRGDDANKSFQKLVYYNPAVQLDKKYFAPSVIKKIKRARERQQESKPLGNISIKADPMAAKVYVNDVFMGVAPLEIAGYPEGTHVVMVMAANYKTRSKLVTVRADRTSQVQAKLAWTGKDRRFPEDMVGFHRDQFDTPEELIGASAAAANTLQVRKLILVEVERKKGQDYMNAYVIDKRLRTMHRIQSIALDDTADPAQVNDRFASQVKHEMENTIMDNPQELAAAPEYGDISLLGKKRSLLKSPWFWGSIGVAAAGGTTAGILATMGTNSVGAINVIFR